MTDPGVHMSEELVITIPSKQVNPRTGYPNQLPAGAAARFLGWIFREITEITFDSIVDAKIQEAIQGPIKSILNRQGRGGVLIEVPIYAFLGPNSPLILQGQGVYSLGWGTDPTDAGATYLRYDHLREAPPQHAKISDNAYFVWVSQEDGVFKIVRLDHASTWKNIERERTRRNLELEVLERKWESEPARAQAKALDLLEKELERASVEKAKRAQILNLAHRAAETKADFKKAQKAVEDARSRAKRAAGISTFLKLIEGLQIGVGLLSEAGNEISSAATQAEHETHLEKVADTSKYALRFRERNHEIVNEIIIILDRDGGATKLIDKTYRVHDRVNEDGGI